MDKNIITKLRIKEFKGVELLELEFNDGDNKLYADNGVGKTTIADAISWMLTHKDSKNSATFSIKPLKPGTKQALVGTEPNVEIVIGGVKLAKIAKEKLDKDGNFEGNLIKYYVNDIEKQKGDYDIAVEKVFKTNTKLLQVLTNALAFNNLKWQDQRALLQELFISDGDNTVDDETLARELGYDNLAEYLKFSFMADVSKSLKNKIKALTTSLDHIKGQIAETKSNIHAYSLDYDKIKSDLKAKQGELDELKAKIDAVPNPKEYEVAIEKLKNENRELELEHSENHLKNYYAKLDELKSKKDNFKDIYNKLTNVINDYKRIVEENNKKLEKLNNNDMTCHECKQSISDEIVNERKIAVLSELSNAKQFIENYEKERQDVVIQGKDVAKQIEQLEKTKSNGMPDEVKKTIEHNLESIQELKAKIDELKNDTTLEFTRSEKVIVEANIDSLKQSLAKEELQKTLIAREQKLIEEQQGIVNDMDKIEDDLEDIKKFILHKAKKMEETINNNFENLHFSLFKYNIDGEIGGEHCEVFWQEKPFSVLSRSEQIKAGLEIIFSINKKIGTCLPVVIDDAEAITTIPKINTQTIQLIKPQISDEELNSNKYNKIVKGKN